MSITPVLVYRNQDSTLDLNRRAARIIDHGIFNGGYLSPSATSLSVEVAPFVVAGYDGIVAISDDTETLSVPAPEVGGANRVSYLILHLEYRSGTASIANLQVVPESTWTSSIHSSYFVTFARFEIPDGSTSLQDAAVIIDYSVGDWAEKLGKTGWRSPVADFASLPAPTTSGPNLGNKDGDIRITLDTLTPYAWSSTASAWSPIGGAIDLIEAVGRSTEYESQQARAYNGSGLIGSLGSDLLLGGLGTVGGFNHRNGSYNLLPVVAQSSLPNRVDLGPIHAVINGHFVKTPYTALTLTAPSAGRYDVVYLEVWREALAGSVSDEVYPNDPTVGGTSTFAQLQTSVEQLLENFNTPNIGFGAIEAYDSSTYVATRWSIGTQEGVSSLSLHDTSAAAASVSNLDGNVFSISTGQTDQRLWSAASTTSVDGISWAIPLFLVRRTLSEAGAASYIQETRLDDEDNRYIFDVAPRAELGAGMEEMTTVSESLTRGTNESSSLKGSSGFLKNTFSPIVPTSGGFLLSPCTIRVKGVELISTSTYTVALPSPPATGHRRDLVVIEVESTAYPHDASSRWEGPSELRRYSRIGLRSTQWVGRTRTFDVGSSLDTTDAMIAAGYTVSSTDSGLWERTPSTYEDLGGGFSSGSVYAIPLCLVHRRSLLTWALTPTPTQNQNGSVDRPDSLDATGATPASKEILDLRHTIVSSEAEASLILEESLDLLYRGELRTRMRTSNESSDVSGTQILQVDQISAAPVPDAFTISGTPEGSTTVWGDSDEAVLLSATFPVWTSGGVVTDDSSTPTFTWEGNAAEGFVTVTAPPGYVINLEDQEEESVAPAGVFLTTHTINTGSGTDHPRSPNITGVVALDTEGNVTSFTSGALALPVGASDAGMVHVHVWARRPARGRNVLYSNNGGMYEVADQVHRMELREGLASVEVDSAPIVVQITPQPIGDVITISLSDLDLALGTDSSRYATSSSALRLYGILDVQMQDASLALVSGLPKILYVDLQNAAGTAPGFEQIRIEFSPGTILGSVTFTVAFDGDLVNRWAIVTPLNRGVRGLYSWHTTPVRFSSGNFSGANEIQPTRGAVASPSRNHMVPFRDAGYSGGSLGAVHGVDFTHSEWGQSDVLLYARNIDTSSTQWRAWTDPTLLDDTTNIGIASVLTLGTDFSTGTSVPLLNSGYSAYASVANNTTPVITADDYEVLVVSPCRVPITSAQTLLMYYDRTPYQGLGDSYPLQDKTTGTVLSVGDVDIHTMGTNLPWINPRSLAWAADGSISLEQDTGSHLSRGQDSVYARNLHSTSYPVDSPAFIYSKSRPVGALTRRLPTGGSLDETLLSNAILTTRPISSARTTMPEEATVFTLFPMFYSGGRWGANAIGLVVTYPIIVPNGSTINSISVHIGRGSVSLGADMAVSLVKIEPTGTSGVLFTDTISTTNVGAEIVLPSSLGIGELKTERNNYYVQFVTTTAEEQFVYTVTTHYREPTYSGQVNRHMRLPYIGRGNSATLRPGTVLSNPWSDLDFAALEAEFMVDGAHTYGNTPRGRRDSFTIDIGPVSVVHPSESLLYYVPLSGFDYSSIIDVTGAFLSWPLFQSPRSLELPESYSSSVHEVYGAYAPNLPLLSSARRSLVGAVTSYSIQNADGTISMVVSHSIQGGATLEGSRIQVVTGAGATIDAFYPAGRPIYIKD